MGAFCSCGPRLKPEEAAPAPAAPTPAPVPVSAVGVPPPADVDIAAEDAKPTTVTLFEWRPSSQVFDLVIMCNQAEDGQIVCTTVAGGEVGRFRVPPGESPFDTWVADKILQVRQLRPNERLRLINPTGQIFWPDMYSVMPQSPCQNSSDTVPPGLLTRLRTEEHVVVTEDLRQLDRPGFKSIFECMATSETLKSIRFIDTGLDQWYLDETDTSYAGKVFENSWVGTCKNRQCLELIDFQPALTIPSKLWSFSNALRLEKVTNGDQVLYDRSLKHPQSDLRAAIDVDDAKACAALLRSDADIGPTFKDYDLAVSSNHWSTLATLLAASPPSDEDARKHYRNGALEGSTACVELLLFWGVKVDCRTADGRTALLMAAGGARVGVMKFLLKAQADPHAANVKGKSALHFLCEHDCGEGADLILSHRADVNRKAPGVWDRAPIHSAAQTNAVGVARALIAAGAQVDIPEQDQERALHVAAQKGNADIVRILLDARADPNLRPVAGHFKGKTALEAARMENALACARLLALAASTDKAASAL